MIIHELESFAAVAELGSFTKAAENLSITQPAVTRHILNLERVYNTRLFDRMGRGVKITAPGRVLLAYARQILSLNKQAEQGMRELSDGAGGQLSIGASSTAATYRLPSLLRILHDRYPAIELSVYTGTSVAMTRLVMDNAVDVGVVMQHQTENHLSSVAFAEYENVLVMHPGHRLDKGHGSRVDFSELRDETVISMQPGTTMRSFIDKLAADNGRPLNILLELDNVEAIKKMVEARLGVAVLPDIALAEDLSDGTLVARQFHQRHGSTENMAAIYRSDRYIAAPVQAFLDVIESGKAHRA